jgi:serine/threonine-protein kinase
VSDLITHLNDALEGRYHIERELGEGGMATVYLADDIKHERKVALKVLKPELAAVVGAERFLAEIKTTAGLQHPHILPLHDSGEAGKFLFYVMPYVAGESLKERIDREKQLSVEDAVTVTQRLASALAYAHGQGVIHRDIKPGNILRSEQGEPLVADFGIALAVAQAGGGRLTETGLSLGTPHYMSPEQATGDQMVGAATDIYALGCVLYQMLVGEPPYTGSTAQAVLGKIIAGRLASATEQRASVPANVDAAIRKALEKLPADRFARAEDFASALTDPTFRHGDDGSVPGHAVGGRPAWRRALGTAAGFALGMGVALSAWAVASRNTARPEVILFTIVQPDSIPLHGGGNARDLAISPDGSLVIYQALSPSGDYLFYVRPLDEPESAPLRGTDGGAHPFFSPDGLWVGFIDSNSDDLWKVSIFGGPPVLLTNLPGTMDGASWGTDDMIVFGTRAGGLFRVAGGGGEPEPLTTLDTDQGESAHIYPHIIEGQDAVVFVIAQTGASPLAGGQLAVLDLRSGDVKRLGLTGASPRYIPTGHLVYAAEDGSIRAVAFDAGRRKSLGVPSHWSRTSRSRIWGRQTSTSPGMDGSSTLAAG